jgi:site-specific DNA recombinase
MSRTTTAAPASVRCAIYCRKSSDEGLDLAFNSLHAQRESGEAFIASQRNEGWTCLPDQYNDGGYSGGNLDRPALQRLLTDIKAGKVDCVVVYKVDRLSRSLMDFSRVMETFEKHHVVFSAVTQAFSTANSMGRLTLNVLLSFAQFERELVSERTRDKIAAARKKGKWAGGKPVLGYDLEPNTHRLVVNEEEAARVRRVFQTYLRTGSLIESVRELNRGNYRPNGYSLFLFP